MYVFDVLPVINGVARTRVSCSTQFTTNFKPPDMALHSSVVKNIDISISIDTEISERYQY